MKAVKEFTAICVFSLFIFLVLMAKLAFIGFLIFAVIHFVMKFW